VRFDFAAPLYEAQSAVEYRVRLEGPDADSSDWSTETHKEYPNLFEGAYTFHVEARNPRGEVSPEATFQLRILAPWYRTWWAGVFYAVAIAASVWGLVRWRVAALQAENRKLEDIVEERTIEIRHQRDQIKAEEEKSNNLLLNILPSAVAAELRSTGSVEPMAFDEATVCFTDFAGFTLASEKLPPGELVAALHEYFTAFDEIAARYRVEKVKTIGDSYMFVSGVPEPRRSHAVDAVMAALEMVEVVERLSISGGNVRWRVRIGLHSGHLVAGVVGIRKFAFDIWGDTVNLASRIESAGVPGRVNLSQQTYERVRDFIDCEPRGLVGTKEGRAVEMFFAREVIAEDFEERYRRAFLDDAATPTR
jgi:class 3 adenylate cyclase